MRELVALNLGIRGRGRASYGDMRRLSLLVLATCTRVSSAAPGDIGAAAPTSGILVPDSGRWLVLCQARADTDHDGKLSVQYDIHRTHGDQVDTYLVLDTGFGERIDYPAARSAHGEWVAVVHDGKLELIDGATFHRVPLAADLTDDYTWTEQKNSRFISIAANATRLAYLRRDNAIVIRELPSGTERVVPMTAKVWRATVDATGKWAETSLIRADTNHDGKLEWPGGPAVRTLHDCNADTLHARPPQPTDDVTTAWLDLATGKLIEDKAIIGVVGGEFVRRMPDDSLVLGAQRIADASCHARIRGVLDAPPRLFVLCGASLKSEDQTAIVTAGPGVFASTRVNQYRLAADMFFPYHRFELIDDHTLVDLADGHELVLPGKLVGSWLQRFVLVDAPAGFIAYDLEQRIATPLGMHGHADDQALGEQIKIDGALWDLRLARKLAPPSDTIGFVDPKGRVLRYAARSQPGFAPMGPLRWDP